MPGIISLIRLQAETVWLAVGKKIMVNMKKSGLQIMLMEVA